MSDIEKLQNIRLNSMTRATVSHLLVSKKYNCIAFLLILCHYCLLNFSKDYDFDIYFKSILFVYDINNAFDYFYVSGKFKKSLPYCVI